MLQISLSQLANQSFQTVVAQQNCYITLRTLGENLYFSLSVDENVLVTNKIVRNSVPLVLYKHYGFIGDFIFVDLQGNTDPTYDELNTRYVMMYLEESEIA